MTKAYLTREEAKEYTKRGDTMLKRWAASGEVRTRKDKRKVMYRREDLDHILLNQNGAKRGTPAPMSESQDSASVKLDDFHPPAWLNPKATENFRVLVEQLKKYDSHIHSVNVHGLAMCAKYLTEFQICEEMIQKASEKDPENGGFITVDKNDLERIHPLTRYQRQCAELFFEYSARYGLTPSDREKLKLVAKEAATEDKGEPVR